jgi:hypothetical protein
MTPMEAISAERQRQITVEGWTPEHDNKHRDNELLTAAVVYFQHAVHLGMLQWKVADGTPAEWPWDSRWWKPKDPWRDLVRAGALCLAEKDRIIRQHEARMEIRRHVTAGGRPSLYSPPGQPWTNHVEQKLGLIVAAMERLCAIERMRDALKPFATAAEDLADGAADNDHIWESPAAMSVTAGHLRAAKRALITSTPTEAP